MLLINNSTHTSITASVSFLTDINYGATLTKVYAQCFIFCSFVCLVLNHLSVPPATRPNARPEAEDQETSSGSVKEECDEGQPSIHLIPTHNQSFVLQKNEALWLLSDTLNYCCAINRLLNGNWHHQSCCGQRNMTISLLRRYRKEHVFRWCKRTHESTVIIQ